MSGLMIGLLVVDIREGLWIGVPIAAILSVVNLCFVVPDMIRLWNGEKAKDGKSQKESKP